MFKMPACDPFAIAVMGFGIAMAVIPGALIILLGALLWTRRT
jgi:hypothetical protein